MNKIDWIFWSVAIVGGLLVHHFSAKYGAFLLGAATVIPIRAIFK